MRDAEFRASGVEMGGSVYFIHTIPSVTVTHHKRSKPVSAKGGASDSHHCQPGPCHLGGCGRKTDGQAGGGNASQERAECVLSNQ